MTFLTDDAGFEYFKKFLVSSGYKIHMVSPKNKDRHLLITVQLGGGAYLNFYCMFKKEFVHSFNYLFPKFVKDRPDVAGHGESINVECLDKARSLGAELIYIYPDGQVYKINAEAVYRICSRYNLIRVQDRKNEYKKEWGYGSMTIIQEKVYMFPVKLFEVFK